MHSFAHLVEGRVIHGGLIQHVNIGCHLIFNKFNFLKGLLYNRLKFCNKIQFRQQKTQGYEIRLYILV